MQPLKQKAICTVTKVRIVSVSVLVGSLIFGFSYALRFTVLPGRFGAYSVNGARRYMGTVTWFTQACSFIEFILRFVLPLTTMMVSNTWTLAIIRKSDVFRRKCASSANEKRSPKCLATTIGLVVVFFCTQLVHGILFGRENRGTLFSETIFISGSVMTKANSIVNFFVYLILGREFRREFLLLIGAKQPEKERVKQVKTVFKKSPPDHAVHYKPHLCTTTKYWTPGKVAYNICLLTKITK
jgi:hypothetical protein